MANFRNRRSAEAWFSSRPWDVVIILCVRMALRTVPLISLAETADRKDRSLNFLSERAMPVFRTASMAAMGTRYSTKESVDTDYYQAIEDTLTAIADEAEEMWPGSSESAAALQTVLEAIITTTDVSDFAQAISSYGGVDLSALTADADFIEQTERKAQRKGVAADIMGRPLWLTGIPKEIERMWSNLKWQLPRDENWSIWTDWYEARLKGTNETIPLEAVVLSLGNRIWEENASQINSTIAQAVDDFGNEEDDIKHDISLLKPIIGVLSPVDFVTSRGQRIRAVPSTDVQPEFQTPTDRRDHKPRLDVCRRNAQSLLDMMDQQRINVREAYRRSLADYIRYLPYNT